MMLVLLVISFLLEGIFSVMVPMNGFLCPLFTIVCLIGIYPYFKRYENTYWKVCVITGVCYDIIYMNTLLVYAGLFLATCYFASILYRFFQYRICNSLLIVLLSILVYRVIGFLLLVITGVIPFSTTKLLDSITSSLFVNLIYSVLLYGVLELFRRQKKIILQR